jgi:anti-anti-sigma factor
MVTGSTVDRLRTALDRALEQQPMELVLDLRDVTFICSQGLVTLLQATRRLPEGGRLVLDHPSGSVRQAVASTRLDRYLTIRAGAPGGEVPAGPGGR